MNLKVLNENKSLSFPKPVNKEDFRKINPYFLIDCGKKFI